MTSPRPTPFHARTASLVQGGFRYGWSDYVLPDVYTSAADELAAVRHAVGAGDVTPLSKLAVTGQDAARLLDHVMTRPVESLAQDL